MVRLFQATAATRCRVLETPRSHPYRRYEFEGEGRDPQSSTLGRDG